MDPKEAKMKRYFLIAAAAVLLVGAFAWAQQGDPGYGGYGPYYGQNLNLTADQQKKLNDLQTKYLADLQSIDSQINQKNLDLRKLLSAAKPDTNAVDKVENDIVKLQNKRYDVTLDYRNKSRSILTKDQLNQSPYAFYGPGVCPYNGGYGGYGGMMGGYGGYGPGYGGMMGGYGGYGPGWGGGMMGGYGGYGPGYGPR
jgi:Spy/CpxP family protein refolding chaperone